jgi:hypothetical protein
MWNLAWVNKAENWNFQTKLCESLPYRIKKNMFYGLVTDTRSERKREGQAYRQTDMTFEKFLQTPPIQNCIKSFQHLSSYGMSSKKLQRWNKGPRLEGVATSGEEEDIEQVLEESR